jgi:hypothetical protein
LDIRHEAGNVRIRDYWHRANQALKEKEEALGDRDYLGVNSELFRYIDPDGMVAEK